MVEYISREDYLHAILRGPRTRFSALDAVKSIPKECAKRRYSKVLIESHLEGPLFVLATIYDLAGVFLAETRSAGVRLTAVALVGANPGLARFAEDFSGKRRLPVSAFRLITDAEDWILSIRDDEEGARERYA